MSYGAETALPPGTLRAPLRADAATFGEWRSWWTGSAGRFKTRCRTLWGPSRQGPFGDDRSPPTHPPTCWHDEHIAAAPTISTATKTMTKSGVREERLGTGAIDHRRARCERPRLCLPRRQRARMINRSCAAYSTCVDRALDFGKEPVFGLEPCLYDSRGFPMGGRAVAQRDMCRRDVVTLRYLLLGRRVPIRFRLRR